MILTHDLHAAARAANALVRALDAELVEHGATTRMYTNRQGRRAARDITGRLG